MASGVFTKQLDWHVYESTLCAIKNTIVKVEKK